MQPRITQGPPNRSSSALATLAPWLPPAPPPRTNRSKSKAVMRAAPVSCFASSQVRRPVVLGLEDHDAIRPGDNGRIRDAEKQTVLDHAGNEFQRLVPRPGA